MMRDPTKLRNRLAVAALGIVLFVGLWLLMRPRGEPARDLIDPPVARQTPAGIDPAIKPTPDPVPTSEEGPVVGIDEEMARELVAFYAGASLPKDIRGLRGWLVPDRGAVRGAFYCQIDPAAIPALVEFVRMKWREPIGGTRGDVSGYAFDANQHQVNEANLFLPDKAWNFRIVGGGGNTRLPVPPAVVEALGKPAGGIPGIRDYHVTWRLCPVTGFVNLVFGRSKD